MRALVILLILAGLAHANPKPPDPDFTTAKRVSLIAVEHLMVMLPPTIYYWRTVDDQKEDWELDWDWPTWKRKLFSTDFLVLDTNRFEPNGLRHPLVGALTYQIGRANGLGPLGATIMNFAASWVWEYIVEFREQVSFNDIVENTTSGLVIGEPLFQIGLLADGRAASPLRRLLGLATSPFHRTQKELALSTLRDDPQTPARLDGTVGLLGSTRTGRWVGELQTGLDVEVMVDRSFATWNRLALDLRIATDGLVGARFESSTTYVLRTYADDEDAAGFGSATLVGIAGGYEYADRDLLGRRDRWATLALAGPRIAWRWRGTGARVALEAGATGDLGMVEAFAFPPGTLEEGSGVLRLRGYYYAGGATAYARGRVAVGAWSAELAGTAHQFWSIDKPGSDDPTGVEDQRATVRANLAVDVHGVRVGLFGDATLRRGTWQMLERTAYDMSAGLGLVTTF